MDAHRDKIHRLWDELAGFPAAESDRALLHLLHTLCAWIGADNAVWSGGVRLLRGAAARGDTQQGWRIAAQQALLPRGEYRDRLAVAFQRRQNGFDPGMAVRALMAEAGRPRVHRMRDGFIDLAAFRRTAYYDAYYRRAGVADRLWAVIPLHADAEAGFAFERNRGQRRRFSPPDAELVFIVLRGLRGFHRQTFLSYGIYAGSIVLSPMQRRITRELLTGKTEKEIAAALGLSPGTIHQYVKRIFQHFGVQGRPALMALWLGSR